MELEAFPRDVAFDDYDRKKALFPEIESKITQKWANIGEFKQFLSQNEGILESINQNINLKVKNMIINEELHFIIMQNSGICRDKYL